MKQVKIRNKRPDVAWGAIHLFIDESGIIIQLFFEQWLPAIYIIPSSWEIELAVVILRTISQEQKKRSVPSHVKYKVDVSEYNFDKKK